jgi:hypothetical protein
VAPSLTPDRDAWRAYGATHEWDRDERSWPDREVGFGGPADHAAGGGEDLEPGPNDEIWALPDDHWIERTYAGLPQVGPHVGRGPKAYQRSDERVREDVHHFLTHDPYVDATEIEVAVEGGEITLSGSVTTRAQKRRAERCLDHIPGVRDVHNRLQVHRSDTRHGRPLGTRLPDTAHPAPRRPRARRAP